MALRALLCLLLAACTVTGVSSDVLERPSVEAPRKEAESEIETADELLLERVKEAYNEGLKNGLGAHALRCTQYNDVFKRTERRTSLPAALIAGIAMHESGGCRMSASDHAGGKGLMQLTAVDQKRHVQPAARMLGVKPSQLRYKDNLEHNVLVGSLLLLDYEQRLERSRPHALLAYNIGVAGVWKVAKAVESRKPGELPSLERMRNHLRFDAKQKPRVYVERVFAATIMMDRALNNQPLDSIETLRPENIPGWSN